MELLRHVEIGDALIDGIRLGVYKPHSRFASEAELMSRFDASRYMVRLALARLVQLGLLRPVQGVGYFVQQAPINLECRIMSNAQYCIEVSAQGYTSGIRVVAADTVAAPPDIAAQLAVPSGTSLHRLELVGTVNDIPLSWSVTWLLASACSGIADCVSDNCSLQTHIRRRYGLELSLVRITLCATYAIAKDVKYLNSAAQSPIMACTHLAANHNGQLVEYTQVRSRGDAYCVIIPLGHQTINAQTSDPSQESKEACAHVQT